MQVPLDKIASVTARVRLPHQVEVGDYVRAERGAVIVVEALEEKSVYGELELLGGRMARIIKGDVIAGVLGERQALKGFVGHIPPHIEPGDTLHVLNMGGVIGLCSSANTDFGQALRVRVLGSAITDGEPASITRNALPWRNSLHRSAPIILVSGTCMNAGKTTAACESLRVLSSRGYRIAAAKLAGVATQRDLLNMQDHGAIAALSFSDAGLPSTTGTDSCLVPAAKGVLAALNASQPDAIIVEFGDGIMGHYGVDILLRDAELMGHVLAHILCANDLVAAWGGLRYLEGMGVHVDCISGPATDNTAGVDYINKHFSMQAANGRTQPTLLADMVEALVFPGNSHAMAGGMIEDRVVA
ncbi:MAG TPA: hypothetical protein VEW94_03130 [Chloroflexia bacterium]|nr:hypothetical protein [Chloroflexia bacterium]